MGANAKPMTSQQAGAATPACFFRLLTTMSFFRNLNLVFFRRWFRPFFCSTLFGSVLLLAGFSLNPLFSSNARADGLGTHADPQKSSLAGVTDVEGRLVNPFTRQDSKAVVFIFVRTDCPISNRYAPIISRLHAKFAPKHIAFRLVYPDPDCTVSRIKEHLKEFGFGVPGLRDPQHSLVKLAGATVTPEAAVFSMDQHEVYRGRIDNREVAFGQERPVATRHDLDEVLSSIVNGQTVTNEFTQAIGCYITDLP